MERFLLTLKEQAGNNHFTTNHIITAPDRQMVKYHYHRTLKDGVYTNAPYSDTHRLRSPSGATVDIYSIKKLSIEEYNVLRQHIHKWLKI